MQVRRLKTINLTMFLQETSLAPIGRRSAQGHDGMGEGK
jgi:hypothetical protein